MSSECNKKFSTRTEREVLKNTVTLAQHVSGRKNHEDLNFALRSLHSIYGTSNKLTNDHLDSRDSHDSHTNNKLRRS